MSSEELASWVDSSVEASERMLFTITPRDELDEIGRYQRLEDQGWVGFVRSVVASVNRAGPDRREFVADEVALAINASPITAAKLVNQACDLAALPGVLEAVDAGVWTKRHALAALFELDKVVLSGEQRASVAMIALARYRGETPGQLAKLIARLILQVDLDAAQARQDKATGERFVSTYRDVDGQAVIHARGPIAQAAAIEASLDAWLREHPKAADDERTERQRKYDLFVSLLTGGTQAGSWQAAFFTPFSTGVGGSLELAEIPGYGPILPSTAHELLSQTDTLVQVAVDEHGELIAVSDPMPAPQGTPAPADAPEASREHDEDDPGPGPGPEPSPRPTGPSPFGLDRPMPSPRTQLDDEWLASMRLLMSQPPPDRLRPEQLSSTAYTTPTRLRRYLTMRDRHCVFPGCTQRVCDVDHRIPWPLGPTAAWNLQLLCRRHHRAKQAVFAVQLTDDGDYLWTTRGGWQFTRPRDRHRQGY